MPSIKDVSINEYEVKARTRVERSKQLARFIEIIFEDWSNWYEHCQWVATAPISDIVEWASGIERNRGV